MKIQTFGPKGAPTIMLIPGLGVSYEIFTPLVDILEERFHIVAVEVDGFTLGTHTNFSSIDDQAAQIIAHINTRYGGHLACAYGLSLGGKILSRILERGELTIDHAILDAAPLLPLPRWLVGPLRHLQALNVWTCYHWTGFWRWVFHSHYFDVLLEECRKVYPYGGRRAVLDGYKSVYTNRLNSISGNDIHYWYGTKEAFVAKSQARHLKALHPAAQIAIFPKMNHGELLIDHPEEVARRITELTELTN
ncbi:MAG: alpha/beta hydrolase [Tidjanibacter sp.]|nr:alpha/beta hydrolase [Tidjanibacter sp.]